MAEGTGNPKQVRGQVIKMHMVLCCLFEIGNRSARVLGPEQVGHSSPDLEVLFFFRGYCLQALGGKPKEGCTLSAWSFLLSQAD